jgi:hypothetical protein
MKPFVVAAAVGLLAAMAIGVIALHEPGARAAPPAHVETRTAVFAVA